MTELTIRGHQPAATYPAYAVDIDFGGAVIKPRPSARLLFASPQGYILNAYHHPATGKYLLVSRSGNTDYLYLRAGANNILLASWAEPIQDGIISFVPLAERVVVTCRSRIFIVDMQAQTALLVTKPSRPTGVTATAKQQFITLANSLPAQTDRATVTYSAPFFTVDDNTTDNIPGAYQQLYAASPQDVTHCDDAWIRVERYDTQLQVGSTAAPIHDTRTGGQDHYSGLPVDIRVTGWVRMPISHSRLIGVHFFVQQGSVTVHERMYYTPRSRPQKYLVVRVQDGFESDPLEVNVAVNSSDCPAPGGYVVEFNNLPTGTWRIYRQDSLGDWRLVAEGTGTTYTDTKREEELGEKWHEPVFPTGGAQGALLWQNRIVINKGDGNLYISEVGQYAWRDNSDIVKLPSRLNGMAAVGGRLYLNYAGAWWELHGAPGSWMQRRVLEGNSPKPVLGIYVSDAALAAEGRLYLPQLGWQELDLQDTLLEVRGLYMGMAARGTNCIYVLQRARWVKWNEPAIAIWYANGRYELAKSDGIYALDGPPVDTALIEETLPMPVRISTVRLYIDGSGQIQAAANGATPETWTLPVYRDRWRVEDWQLTLTFALSNATVRRILIQAEPTTSYA